MTLTKTSTIKVPKEIRKEWRKRIEHGDYANLAGKYGKNWLTYSRAVNSNSCSKSTFDEINQYLKDKEVETNKLLKEAKRNLRIHETDNN